MMVRELPRNEWTHFFDGFSRRFRGRRMTLQVSGAENVPTRTLADRLPLVGITVESPRGAVESIEVMLGDSPAQNVMHVITRPSRVRISQITNGEDESLTIDTTGGGTAHLYFGPVASQAWAGARDDPDESPQPGFASPS